MFLFTVFLFVVPVVPGSSSSRVNRRRRNSENREKKTENVAPRDYQGLHKDYKTCKCLLYNVLLYVVPVVPVVPGTRDYTGSRRLVGDAKI